MDVSILPLDPKNTAVWIIKARWDKIRESPGFDTLAESLHRIEPNDYEYHALCKIAAHVMTSVNSFIRGASIYFLRGIGNNLPVEAADIFVNTWRAINSSHKMYSDTMAKLLYALVISADFDEWANVLRLFDFQHVGACQLKNHLDIVAKGVAKGAVIGVETQQLFWALAIDLFTYSLKQHHGNPHDHPVYIFVCLLAYKNGNFSTDNANWEYVCQLIFWGHASICLAMRNVTGIMSQSQPDVVDGDNDDGDSSSEPDWRGQLQDRFTLQNRSGDAYMHLDLAIYSAGFKHDIPQDQADLVVSLADIAISTHDADNIRHSTIIPNDDRQWRGLHLFLEDGKPVPMGSLFALYGLLSGAADDCIKSPIVYWTPNSNYCCMTYRNVTPVKIEDLAHAYVSAIDQIRKLLDKLLKPIVSTKLPPLKDLIDCRNDPNNPAAFLIHPDNNFGQHLRTLFHAHVKQETFLSSPTPSRASTYKLTTWLSKVAKLINYLLFVMHLSGGQPA
ncbi:hypothetical protein H4S07_002231 [Coemansia furcata]|uniref:Uncharacterized protein n=1 Tax=Coemansia furcata TaxID=417177 RepID=A0ACC1LM68_9FUNG|nr:hypothetical protein H4S07_002231 [Coemansia furcata]